MLTSKQLKETQQATHERYKSVKDIYSDLVDHARWQRFFEQPKSEVCNQVDNFVKAFAQERGLAVHAVRPMSWSFEIEEHMLFNDGIIDLSIPVSDKDIGYFVYVDVSDCKVTDPEVKIEVPLFDDHKVINMQAAYIDRTKKSLASWEEEFSQTAKGATDEIKESIHALKQRLESYQADMAASWREMQAELDQMVRDVREKIRKHRDQ